MTDPNLTPTAQTEQAKTNGNRGAGIEPQPQDFQVGGTLNATEAADGFTAAATNGNGDGYPNQDDPNLYNLERAPEQDYLAPRFKIYYWRDKPRNAADETQQMLMDAGEPVYQRAGRLVMPIFEDHTDKHGRIVRATRFVTLTVPKLRYLLNKPGLVQYFETVGRGRRRCFERCAPPDVVSETLLAPEHWKLPKAYGIITAPTLRWDGSVLDQRGYDEKTKLHADWEDGLRLPPMPAQPTRADAKQALQLLKDELLCEAAFVDTQLDQAVALAAFMTPVLHGAFELCPLFLFLAHVSGSGKSYLVDMASTIANGRDAPVITGTRNEEEMEKRIGSVLLEGSPFISIDNLSFDLSSDIINQMCTQSIVKPRILGKSKTPECHWNGVLYATGNNITLLGDLIRRGLLCNLDRKMERPYTHKYAHKPIQEIRKDRGKYVAAILIIARAYLLSGDKVDCPPFGGYEDWSRFVREALIWLGCSDVINSQSQADRDDPYRTVDREFLVLWKKYLLQQPSYTSKEILKVGEANWELGDLLMQRCGDGRRVEVKKFGRWLRDLHNKPYTLTREENGQDVPDGTYRITVASYSKSHGNRWKFEKLG